MRPHIRPLLMLWGSYTVILFLGALSRIGLGGFLDSLHERPLSALAALVLMPLALAVVTEGMWFVFWLGSGARPPRANGARIYRVTVGLRVCAAALLALCFWLTWVFAQTIIKTGDTFTRVIACVLLPLLLWMIYVFANTLYTRLVITEQALTVFRLMRKPVSIPLDALTSCTIENEDYLLQGKGDKSVKISKYLHGGSLLFDEFADLVEKNKNA